MYGESTSATLAGRSPDGPRRPDLAGRSGARTSAPQVPVQRMSPSPERRDVRPKRAEVVVETNPLLVVALLALVTSFAFAWFAWRGWSGLSVYGAVVGVILGGKLLLSLLPAAKWPAAPEGVRTCLVVPIYNEDPAILASNLASVDAQTYPVTHVRIIDDGSADERAHDYARRWASTRPHARVVRQPNAGKREAMAQAFRELGDRVEVFVCVDSDTVLEPDAVRNGLAAFHDPRTAAVTGTVVALNHDRGLLPRMLDLRYVNAFLYERAAYSRLGSVLCVCGSLAFWRADIVRHHLDDFLGQRFLGRPCSYGDDRHLTNLSLLHGRVVLARDAVARTAVPERGDHLIRQQVRWGRSFFRESLWTLSHLPPTRAAWWLTLLESVSWLGFTGGLLLALFVLPATTGRTHWVDYLVWVAIAGYARSVHVFSVRRTSWSRWRQAWDFLTCPVYGVLHVVVLLPLRLWSLATLGSTAWGTRARGVEVTGSGAPAAGGLVLDGGAR